MCQKLLDRPLFRTFRKESAPKLEPLGRRASTSLSRRETGRDHRCVRLPQQTGPRMPTLTKPSIRLADEVWLAVAMLQQRQPERPDFSVDEIMDFAKSAKELRFLGPVRPGFYAHVVQHCVANRRASPARYRMLFETEPGRRRLFRSGDPYHPQREGGKTTPRTEDLPENWFRGNLDWYRGWSQQGLEDRIKNDPLLALYGSGKELWADEHADEYVRHLREGWE